MTYGTVFINDLLTKNNRRFSILNHLCHVDNGFMNICNDQGDNRRNSSIITLIIPNVELIWNLKYHPGKEPELKIIFLVNFCYVNVHSSSCKVGKGLSL